ncbi:TetR/AcrR family transcriptional regulator [Trinickia sp. YCB016]
MKPNLSAPKPRGRRPSVEDFDVREHMLDTATRLFAERGIAATTVAQIAGEAGVTSAMVHYYFTNREQLLDAIVEERLARAVEFVWRPVEHEIAGDPFAFANELVERLFDVTARMPWLPPLWMREIVNEGGLLRERMLKRIPVEHVKRFASHVQEAQQAGTVNPGLDPVYLFHSILALVMLPLATSKIWKSARGMPQFDRDVLRRHVRALLGYGMQVPEASSSRAAVKVKASSKSSASASRRKP